MGIRIERDSMGEIEVAADRYWGAQTQRSIENFKIGSERLPRPLIRALGLVKQCAAAVNRELGDLPHDVAEAVRQAAQEVIDGRLDDHFPLVVWQTGSGTQSNMNAQRGDRQSGGGNRMGEASRRPIAACTRTITSTARNRPTMCFRPRSTSRPRCEIERSAFCPRLPACARCLNRRRATFDDIVKIGRTHLQDATPLTLGQEFSGYADQIRISEDAIRAVLPLILELPIGGTAVGTGLNTRTGYPAKMAAAIAERTGLAFAEAPNRFASMAGKEGLVAVSGALKTAAGALNKIANDVRWLASGPRCGIGEILIPANEPGSSIMPGKVNPTQSEALTMVATRVIGNDVTVTVAGGSGNFELNVYLPVIGYTVLQSVDLLAGAADSFHDHCAAGIEANRERIDENLHRSLMLVTALNPHIGYDRAADVAKTAYAEGKTLREVVIEKGLMSGERFDEVVVPARMVRPSDG